MNTVMSVWRMLDDEIDELTHLLDHDDPDGPPPDGLRGVERRARLGELRWRRFMDHPLHSGDPADLAAAADHLQRVVDGAGLRGAVRQAALLGLVAQMRFLLTLVSTGVAIQDDDFEAANHYLSEALGSLAADDPLRPEVSSALGVLLLADHETRCGRPCPVPHELPRIADLLAVAAHSDQASITQLYPYATLTLARMYEHTHAQADLELAITWLRRTVRHPDLTPADRRRVLINLADRLRVLGDVLRDGRGGSGPGSDCWSSYSDAIKQFEAVLDDLVHPGTRDDTARQRQTDALDARLGLIETYLARGGDHVSDADLDTMIELGRTLTGAMGADYPQRSFALGRYGALLVQRITRRVGDPWDSALEATFARLRPTTLAESVSGVPGLDADLHDAIDVLTIAVGLHEPPNRLHPLFASTLATARILRHMRGGPGDPERDLPEVERLIRVVLEHPATDAGRRRFCGRFLMLIMVRRLRMSDADFDAVRAVGGRVSSARRIGPLPPVGVDLNILIGLLGQFIAADASGHDSEPAAAYTWLATGQVGPELTDDEIAVLYERQRDAAVQATTQPDTVRALLLFQFALVGSEWVRRGTSPDGVAADVAEAFGQAVRGFPASNPMARFIASHSIAFEIAFERELRSPQP